MDGWMGVKAVLRIAYSNQKVHSVKRRLGLMTSCPGFLEVDDLNWCAVDNIFKSE